jgi:hypothetical protein
LQACIQSLPAGKREPFQHLAEELERYWSTVDPIFAPGAKEKNKSGNSVLRNDVLSQQIEVLAISKEVSAVNDEELKEAERRIAEAFAQFRRHLLMVATIAFTFGLILAGRIRVLRIVGGLIVAYGALGLVWPFAPMHLREALAAGGSTLSDTMHIVLGGVTVVLMLLAIAFGAAALGKRFLVYSIASLVILVAFGALTFLDAPRIAANLPTPWIGVWERINIGVFLVWVVVLAVSLLRAPVTASGSSDSR